MPLLQSVDTSNAARNKSPAPMSENPYKSPESVEPKKPVTTRFPWRVIPALILMFLGCYSFALGALMFQDLRGNLDEIVGKVFGTLLAASGACIIGRHWKWASWTFAAAISFIGVWLLFLATS